MKKLLVIAAILFASLSSTTNAAQSTFESKLAKIGKLLEQQEYNTVVKKFFANSITIGKYQKANLPVERSGIYKNNKLKRYSYKVLSIKSLKEKSWKKHFGKTWGWYEKVTYGTLKNRGVIITEVLDKKTNLTYGTGDETTVFIFQVIQDKHNNIKITGVFNARIKNIKKSKLYP